MGERRRGEQPRRRHAEVAAGLVGDISVGAMGAATDVQMPKFFEIVLSTGVDRQSCNTCVIFGRMRVGSAHIHIYNYPCYRGCGHLSQGRRQLSRPFSS